MPKLLQTCPRFKGRQMATLVMSDFSCLNAFHSNRVEIPRNLLNVRVTSCVQLLLVVTSYEELLFPFQVYRRYISGSPKAHVTLSGDVIGPIFPGDEPVSLRTMFPSGNGRSVLFKQEKNLYCTCGGGYCEARSYYLMPFVCYASSDSRTKVTKCFKITIFTHIANIIYLCH